MILTVLFWVFTISWLLAAACAFSGLVLIIGAALHSLWSDVRRFRNGGY